MFRLILIIRATSEQFNPGRSLTVVVHLVICVPLGRRFYCILVHRVLLHVCRTFLKMKGLIREVNRPGG